MLKSSVRLLLSVSLLTGLAGCSANLGALVGANGASPKPSASSGTGLNVDANLSVGLPNPLDIATLTGLTAKSCSEEGSLKSSSGAASNITFKNSSSGKVNIYWLDFNGKRVSYKQGLAAGASHQQSTYVSHPWVITNDQDQCMGIYTPSEAGSVTLDVKKTVTLSSSGSASGPASGSSSGSASGSTSGGVYTEAQVRSALQCMKNSGKAQAVSLATAWEFQLNTGASVGKGAEVASALSTSIIASQKGFGLNCL